VRRVWWWAKAGLIAVVALLAVAVAALATLDLAPVAGWAATRALGRRLAVAELHLSWGNPLGFDARGIRLANADWGSAPDMVTLERLTGTVDVGPALHGIPRFPRLEATGLMVLLEHDASGRRNWRFSGKAPTPGDAAEALRRRQQVAVVLDGALHGGTLIMHTASGKQLSVTAREITLRAADDDAPISVEADGAYGETALRVTMQSQSWRTLREGTAPYGMKMEAASTETPPVLHTSFAGTMSDPVGFDGLKGSMALQASRLGRLTQLLGMQDSAAYPLVLEGTLDKQRDEWVLSPVSGKLADNEFQGVLQLTEGVAPQPDAVAVTLRFPVLDMKALVGDMASSQSSTSRPSSLAIDPKLGVVTDVQVDADKATYGTTVLQELHLQGQTRPGEVTITAMQFGFAGGKLRATASAQAQTDGSKVVADSEFADADLGLISRWAGSDPGEIAGRLTVLGHVEMTGDTMDAALPNSHGRAVMAVTQGRINRELVRKLSLDLLAFLPGQQGMNRIDCMLGIVALERGVAAIAPLRMRTAAGSFYGGGTVDLPRQYMDMVLRSQPSTTGALALDIPIRVRGSISKPSVTPSRGATVPTPGPQALAGLMASLTDDQRKLAQGNGCLR
jgi:AsmA family protein